jgi:hypothetical protein
VLLWVSRGKTNRDIGDILGMAPRTVNKHLEHLFRKLNVGVLLTVVKELLEFELVVSRGQDDEGNRDSGRDNIDDCAHRTLDKRRASACYVRHVRQANAGNPPRSGLIIAECRASTMADEGAFVFDSRMAGYGAEPTPERPTDYACERRLVAGCSRPAQRQWDEGTPVGLVYGYCENGHQRSRVALPTIFEVVAPIPPCVYA